MKRRGPVVAFIFARAGSKGLPGKNIKELAGKPLIAYAIEAGLTTPGIERVVVSTDSEEIARVARTHGAEVPFLRPRELATDESPEILSWKHALREMERITGVCPGVLVSLPCTTPLRTSADVTAHLDEFERSGAEVVLTVAEAKVNPYFKLVRIEGGFCRPFMDAGLAGPSRRQEAPPVYEVCGMVYVADSRFVLTAGSLWEGKVAAVRVDAARAVDIDTPLDFEFAEHLLRRKMATGQEGAR